MMSDVSQLRAFAGKLRHAPGAKARRVRATTVKAAVNIKKAVQADLRGSSNSGIRRIPIQYEEPFLSAPMTVTIQIGPEAKAGGLANIAFFGTSKGGGGHRFYEHAEAELDTWKRYLGEAMEGLD
ncbi:hypothetical protein [Bifidobacterium choerinum]|uniref:HK97 gp10 family phage protein n=1 Tax=Bifidobacterium choerinum TaxID=35760 RepID=A0A2D3D6T9_9BIFI|nr:hypothetical protein [Bifidobacterium choerinum]ATU21062.1 hypothetical protein BcFMB_09160 [Bifidobacterium choerinum]